MSIEGFKDQIRYVIKGLNNLESMIEVGNCEEDCISELQDLRGEVKELIKEAEEIIDGINNL